MLLVLSGRGLLEGVASPGILVMHYQRIEAKAALRLEEPIQWKGCRLKEHFKGKCERQKCGSYRDVAISDDSGKSYRRSLRIRTHSSLCDYAL